MCAQWYFAEYFLEMSLSFFFKVQKSYFGGIARFLDRVNENEQIMRSEDSTANIQKQQPGVFYKKRRLQNFCKIYRKKTVSEPLS